MFDFNLTDEQQMLRDAAARFVRDNCGLANYREDAASAIGFRPARWRQFAQLGWLGLAVPEDLGGMGCGLLEIAIVMEELGRGFSLEPYLSSAVLGAHLLQCADATPQRQALIPALVSGELLVALAHDEPDGGYGCGSQLQTVATPDANGFRLSGFKTMALGAPTADKLLVTARLADDAEGRLALFVLDPKAAGVSMTPYPLLDFTRASDIRLDDVRLEADSVLVGVQRAADVLDEAIDHAILASVAEALGCMESVLQLTVAHLKTRVQFGKPLARHQALQHRVAEMFIEIQETRSILLQGITGVAGDPAHRRAAASAAKALATDAARLVGEHGVQLHGGLGVTLETQVSHHCKKLLMFQRLFGGTDFHVERFESSRSRLFTQG